MEKINSMSELAFILIGKNGAATPLSILGFILPFIILKWVVTVQELHLAFSFLFQTISQFLRASFDGWTRGKNANARASSSRPNCINEDAIENDGLINEDVEIVMDKLGIFWDKNGEKFQERLLGYGDVSNLFNEAEPSLEEVKEAFDVFDENKDGYIDEKDLEKMLFALGFVDVSKSDCQRMIMAFDKNGDRRIDFNEFLKIIEDSFC